MSVSGGNDSEMAGAAQGAVDRLLEVTLTLPMTIGARLLGTVPVAIQKTREQLVLARFIGKMAVDRGVRELQRQVADASVGGSTQRSIEFDAEQSERALDSNSDSSEQNLAISAPSLALPDYDQLPAAHVVAKLEDLTQGERDQIEEYELVGRHRRTVLGKLAQLRKHEEQ